ncbi:hypothetical protein D3C78_1422190 [compost metagenome]
MNRLGNRRAAHLRRQLDGAARGAAIEGQARLAIDVDEAQGIARVDQVRVLDLRVGMPELRPLPRLAEELARDIPERVTLGDGIAVWMTFLELHFCLG